MFDADCGDQPFDIQTQACKNLWASVLRSAIADLFRGTHDKEMHRHDIVVNYWRAYLWVTEGQGRVSFNSVCEMAGIDAELTRKSIEDQGLLQRGHNVPLRYDS